MKSIREALRSVVKSQEAVKLDQVVEKSNKILQQEVSQSHHEDIEKGSS